MDVPFAALPPIVAVLLIPLGIFSAFFVLTVIVGVWEKRRIQVYRPMRASSGPEEDDDGPEADRFLPMTPYARTTILAVKAKGFQGLGAFRHGMKGTYKVRYDIFISPDREVLVVVSGGTMASIKYEVTRLHTRLLNGRVLVTTDHQAGMEADMTGLSEWMLVTNADFDELLENHRKRVAEAESSPQPYSDKDPLADLAAFRTQQVDLLVDRGMVRYREPGVWSYTFKGALAYATRAYLKGFADAGRNAGRSSRKRPGEKGYVRSSQSGGWLKALDQAAFVFMMILVVGGVLSFTNGPATNRAQRIFRASVSAVGLIGLVGTWALRSSVRKTSKSE